MTDEEAREIAERHVSAIQEQIRAYMMFLAMCRKKKTLRIPMRKRFVQAFFALRNFIAFEG